MTDNTQNTSIILCTRNRIEAPLCFLRSLGCQTELPQELIIIDSSDIPLNNDSGLQRQMLELQMNMSVKYVHSDPGLTKQRNIGVKSAQGDILYFFDDDIVLEPNYLENMNKAFLEHPECIGGMGTLLKIKRPTLRDRPMLFVRHLFLQQTDYGDGKFYQSGFARHFFSEDQFANVKVLSGAIMAFRKEVFDQFLFDEKLHDYCFMEDVDISKRVSDKYLLFHNPLAKADHRHADGGRGDIFQNRKMYMFNHRYLFMKNYYPNNRFALIPHIWSIIGLSLLSYVPYRKNISHVTLRGYLAGLYEFGKRKTDMLK